MDRRSSFVDPAVRYDLQREFEDVAAVANHLREPVSLVGASSGAVCALGAAPLVRLLHRLILYEPPLVGGSSTSLDHVERILADGDLEGAAEGFLRDAVKLSGDAIGAMKSAPRWADVVASAPQQIREVAILRTRLPDVDAFAEHGVPTLFLTGDKTPTAHHHRGYIEVLKAARVELTVVAIEGQEHFAYRGAPEQFARYVLDFLEGE
jgi:pimeloyl-ACP methyl ester carboxylesterase